MAEETLFWLIVGVIVTASLLLSAAIGYRRERRSLLVAVLILSILALGAGTGISVAYGGYLGVMFVPAILLGYLLGRALDSRSLLDRGTSSRRRPAC